MKKFLIILLLSIILFNLGNQTYAQSDDKLVILHTNLGQIVIEFFPNDAPNHVANIIKLTENGFYDNTIFHRIIPGFMIQGGDPNTKDTNTSNWGTGGPGYSVNSEFNTIMHNRGIVSMARSTDPNSAGSQFFIVHKDSNFLDQQYTVFGRIATQESFETLDKIASVTTGDKDIPLNTEQVKITKMEVIRRSEISNLLEQSDPQRITSEVVNSTGDQLYENKVLDITFNIPEGWLIQQPTKSDPTIPDVVAVGAKVGSSPPVISLTISNMNGKSIDDMIQEKNKFLKTAVDSGNFKILSQEKSIINGNQAYITNAAAFFQTNETAITIQFREVIISTNDKFYSFTYSNGIENFNDYTSKFEESTNSFKIISESIKEKQPIIKDQFIFIIFGIIAAIGIVFVVLIIKKRNLIFKNNNISKN